MELIKIITKENEYIFGKDDIKLKSGLKTKTHSNTTSYLINNNYVVISSDKIVFECDICKKEVIKTYSNFKNRKHDLCISCTRKKTVTEVHKNMNKEDRKELNDKISKTTKIAMNNITPEKRLQMTEKMLKSMNWDIRNKHWLETMSNKSNEEKKEIGNKISQSLKKHYREQGPWNLKKILQAPLNKAIPENKWFTRGVHSSNETLSVVCDDCGQYFKSKRANLAKQEEIHPGGIYCIKCKSNGERNSGYIDGRKYIGNNTYTAKFYNNDNRKILLELQNYICPICNENLNEAHLHHIDYNKKNDNNDNLIFLHPSCHMKTNFNREFWKVFFDNYNKSYYDELNIPTEYVEEYFTKFPLINHKFNKSLITQQLKNRRNFTPSPPNTKGHNISKMLSNKYFYSRKRKNNSSIVEILSSSKILKIYKHGDSLSNIINKITSQLYSYPVSLFSHHIMDWILQKWSHDNDIIYDPAGGFGGRLLGTYYHDVKYITTDPYTFNDLENINNLLNLNAIIHDKRSEDLKMKCDMVVCCPPYYNDENYENIEERDYDIWLEEYWQQTINNIESDKFVLIIGEKYPEMINIVSQKWNEQERFVIENKSFKSNNKEFIIYFEK